MIEKLEEKLANTVVVTIHPDGTVDPNPIVLYTGKHGRIMWVSDAEFACDMVFTEGHSPFHDHVFHVEKRMWKESGPIREEVHGNDNHFHFDAQSKGRTVAADPDVIIKN